MRTSGVVQVDAPSGLQCGQDPFALVPLAFRCTAPGNDKVTGVIYAMAVDLSHRGAATAEDDAAIHVQLLRSTFALANAVYGGKDTFRGELEGTTFAYSFRWDITCTAPSASTTSTTVAPARTTIPSAVGAPGPTGSTGPTPAAPAPTRPPSSSTTMAPATTVPPSTTVPSDPVIPTTTFAPDAPWGAAGTWSHNEYGSCDYNGSGGCGWYFGPTRGEYLLGPLGDPDATIPV